MTDKTRHEKRQPGVAEAAFLGLCPRCGAKTLFEGVVQFAPHCRVCGLDFSRFNVGDGPAAFLTLIIGGLIVGLAMWLELAVHPPFWVHVVLWIPVTALAVVFGLRVAKGALLASEYRNKAGEGTSGDPDIPGSRDKNQDQDGS